MGSMKHGCLMMTLEMQFWRQLHCIEAPFACLGLGSTSAACCLNLALVSNSVPRPQLSLVIFVSASACSWSFRLKIARTHELITFQGFVVHLVHTANEFFVLNFISGRHYYCTFYWFYVSGRLYFLFFSYFYFSGNSLCLPCFSLGVAASASVLPRFQLSLPRPLQFCLGLGPCLEKMPWLHHWLTSLSRSVIVLFQPYHGIFLIIHR